MAKMWALLGGFMTAMSVTMQYDSLTLIIHANSSTDMWIEMVVFESKL